MKIHYPFSVSNGPPENQAKAHRRDYWEELVELESRVIREAKLQIAQDIAEGWPETNAAEAKAIRDLMLQGALIMLGAFDRERQAERRVDLSARRKRAVKTGQAGNSPSPALPTAR